MKIIRKPFRTFLAGPLTLLPLVLTVAAVIWVANVLHNLAGPGSSVGQLLVSIGLAYATDDIAAYLLGFFVVVLCIFVFGMLVQLGLKSRLQVMEDWVLRRVPLIGSLYDLTHRFVGIFERQGRSELKNMSPVWCFFGGRGGTRINDQPGS